MSCTSAVFCTPRASREDELVADVIIVGGGFGGLVTALELKRYGYRPRVVYIGHLGGHHILGNAPRYSDYIDVQSIISKASELDVIEGFFDGIYIYHKGIKYRVRYKHLVLATGGFDAPITFPNSIKAPQKTAEEVLLQQPTGLKIAVWGTTEWGLRTALTLKRLGNDVIVLDNSAYIRDTKYFEKVKKTIDFPIATSVRIKSYDRGVLKYNVITEKRTIEKREEKLDLIVSTVRMVNPYVVTKLGFKVYYSFELNSLIPRRTNLGELLTLDDTGRAVGGSNIYVTGHLYGAVRENHIVEQARLLAMYIASKDGLEDGEKVKDGLGKFLATLAVEANWLYNLGNRLEYGTDNTGRYIEPNVIDVPHWASYWPQEEDIEGVIICPCDNTPIDKVLKEVKEANRLKEIKTKITHKDVELLRQLKLPQLSFGESVCAESMCLPYATIILGALLGQKPSYFIYGKLPQ